MKLQRLYLGLAGAAVFLSLPAIAEEAQDKLATDKDRISYVVGVETARNFKKQGFEFDTQLFLRGMQDVTGNQKLLLGDKDLRKVLAGFQTQVRQTMAVNRKALTDENRKKAADFLAANKTKDGVFTTASGLQYKVIKQGNGGRKPSDSDTVLVDYRGTLLDGTEFDATEPGHPAPLRLTMVIPGWKEALKLMVPGAKWQLFVPPVLGYGERGVGNDIGPNELLLFDVELVEIK
jgi:FKBP-type peptidyl-prolyl cis-trans isomerase FklB